MSVLGQERPKLGDLVMLRSEAGQRGGFERGQSVKVVLTLGEPFPQRGVVVLEPFDLDGSGVWSVSVGAEFLQALLEFGF